MTCETLTSHAAVEDFADAVVDRFPGTAEVQLAAIPVRPVVQRRRGERRPVVALDDGGQAAAEVSQDLAQNLRTWRSS